MSAAAEQRSVIALWKDKLDEAGRHPIYVASDDAWAFVRLAHAVYWFTHEPLLADEPSDAGQVVLLDALKPLFEERR